MPVSLRLILSSWIALALGLLLLLAPGPAGTSTAHAATASTQVSADHPYSDPTWFPLRAATKIGCAKSGCGTSEDHGYWAIDLLGTMGDPVYAAGAGIAHIGGNSGDCSSSSEVGGGRWVWIDHGGSIVTRYYHLDSIAINDGQLVTPATQIGSMGHSGDVSPCQWAYLHFEVRQGGLYGDHIPFGSLTGCQGGKTVKLPDALGFSDWNDPGLHPKKKFVSPELDNSCITGDWLKTAAKPAPTMSRGDASVSVGLAAGDAESWMVNLEIWRPSLNDWRTLSYRTLEAGTTSTTFTDEVENNRQYRVQVAVHQRSGWSAWSTKREVVATPAAPDTRYLRWKRPTNKSKSYLHYGWTRPVSYGSPVTTYDVSRRCGTNPTKLGSWKSTSFNSATYWNNFGKLKKNKACEVRIRANNAAGAGDWSELQPITR